ncbi:hypothetical protein [Phenylobacterium zucineum]|uniref:hypothetical protein n=1 Tax=Phenylobacterium zucineum TaxID=284016 RepID=UPI00030537E7|nr:hypothetical protein [Phenylobacterium zucineum]
MLLKTSLASFAAAAAVVIALPAVASPDIPTVGEVAVGPSAPTEVRLSIAGKDRAAVRQEVRSAARYVCRNAVLNRELDVGDNRWCSHRSAVKAMVRYDAMREGAAAYADAQVLVLSAR